MVEPQSEPIFPVGFDDDALEEDLAHLPVSAEKVLRLFRKEARRLGRDSAITPNGLSSRRPRWHPARWLREDLIPWPTDVSVRCSSPSAIRTAPGPSSHRYRYPPPPARIERVYGLRDRTPSPLQQLKPLAVAACTLLGGHFGWSQQGENCD